MNPKVPPAIEYLKANPNAPIYDVAIDHGVSNSTLRHAWAKIKPVPGKAGRPQEERTKRAIAFRLANPGVTQVEIARQFKITPATLSRSLKRIAVKCPTCGALSHG